jgi:hypothetical protein
MTAFLANNIMNNLFHNESICNHVLNFNAQTRMSGERVGFITNEQVQELELAIEGKNMTLVRYNQDIVQVIGREQDHFTILTGVDVEEANLKHRF